MFKKLNHNGNNFEFPDNEKGRKDYEAFIAKFPDATEVAIAPDPDEEGKEIPSQETESAAVEESVALEPTVTGFTSEDTLSELSKIEVPQVKTGTVADTKEINKIYQKAAEEAPKALDEILKVREKITTAEITDKTASNYFNLEEVNRKLEERASITTGFGTQSIYEREPTQKEKEERVYNNGLNMPNATPESAQEYLDT